MAQKIIIASGKGGAGKTSLTSGIALSLAKRGKSVLVVDFDIGQGCVDFMIGGDDTSLYNWGDVIKGNCEPHEAIGFEEAVDTVSSPAKWDNSFTEESVKKFIEFIENDYEYILFDSPAGVSGGFKLAAACADGAIIVSTPDEICTKAAASAADELYSVGIDDIRLVINRFNKAPTTKGKFLNIDEVIDAVNVQLIGVVPEDKEITYASSTGFSFLKDCPAKASYGRIADRICGKKVPLVLKNSKRENPGSKAPLFIVLGVILAVIIAVAGVFAVDCYMCNSLKKPVFVLSEKSKDETHTEYKGLFYYVETENDGEKIISSELKINDKVIVAAIS